MTARTWSRLWSRRTNGEGAPDAEPQAPWPWAKQYPRHVPTALRYPRMSVGHLLDQAAARYGHLDAIGFDRARITYDELKAQADRFAAGLAQLGVSPGDRIAIALPNCPEYVVAFFATLRLGAVVVQAGPLLGPAELAVLSAKTSPKVVIALDLLGDRIGAVANSSFVQHVITVSLSPHLSRTDQLGYWFKLRGSKYTGGNGESSKVTRYEQLLAEAPAYPPAARVEPDRDLAVLQPTGGTTGGLKVAKLTHANLLANACQVATWTGMVEGQETVLAVLPLFHAYAMTSCMIAPIYGKSTMILQPRFEAGAVLDAIRTHRPTIFPLVPAIAVALTQKVEADAKAEPLPPIRLCVSGAAPLTLKVKEAFEAWSGARIIEGYGLSEASPVTHVNPTDGRDKVGSIGVPLPDTEARVVNPDGEGNIEPLAPGVIGELIIRGPQIMKGYLSDPEATADMIRDGWLWTGDLATMDDDGFFTIVDRRKDLIITAGFNVYPGQVEKTLCKHDGVAECAVVGEPDEEKGEVVKAFVVRAGDSDVSDDALREHCREHLAPYEAPRTIEFVDELPRSYLGKVLKYRMRQAYDHRPGTVAAPEPVADDPTTPVSVETQDASPS
jgi:long-chain acyl-CoA synthetase